MPQALLPMIPGGATSISDPISVVRQDGYWTYFCSLQPIFHHSEDDSRSFRMFTAQLVCQDACTQLQIIQAFGVSANSVKRSVRKYREGGIAAFYEPRRGRGPSVMTDNVKREAERLLHLDWTRADVADELGINGDPLSKAINQGRVSEPSRSHQQPRCDDPETVPSPPAAAPGPSGPTDRSTRSDADATAEMGTACTRPGERVLAAMGMLHGAPPRFEPCRDVSFGGVLCALPALAENGLFRHLKDCFPTLSGYYATLHVVILLAQMALCRIRTVERLQYEAPGELGKLMGLDRVPEVRCLRQKLTELSAKDAPEQWAGVLSRQWMEQCPEMTGTLYADGHVRLYFGDQTKLPRRYVARERLCLRGTTDYWVNDAIGQPFFAVERPIDHGLLEALRSDIVPRLLQDVPGQPTEQQLRADPNRFRFVIVFDREATAPPSSRRCGRITASPASPITSIRRTPGRTTGLRPPS